MDDSGACTPQAPFCVAQGGALMAKMRKKADLPQKDCAHCKRPFTWRRKWARDWDAVRYCSEKCRSLAKSA